MKKIDINNIKFTELEKAVIYDGLLNGFIYDGTYDPNEESHFLCWGFEGKRERGAAASLVKKGVLTIFEDGGDTYVYINISREEAEEIAGWNKNKEEAQPETVTEEVKTEQVVGDKVYWSVVRCKTNINSQPFILMKVDARSKKHAEDVIFNTNFAPYGNKIFTKEQMLDASIEWLNKVGIQSKEELTRLMSDAEEGKVTA